MLHKKPTNQRDFPKPRNLSMSHIATASLSSPQPLPGGMCWMRHRGISSTFLISWPTLSLSTHSGSRPLPCFFRCPWTWVFVADAGVSSHFPPQTWDSFPVYDAPPLRPSLWTLPQAGSDPLCPFFRWCIWALLFCPACLSSSDLIGHRTLTLACWKAFCVNLGAMMSSWQSGPGPVLSNPGPGALGSCLLRYKLGYMLKTLSDFNSPHWTSKTRVTW